MQVIVSARHTDVTDRLRKLVEDRFERLDRFEPRVLRAEVTLLEEKNRCEVEAQVSVAGSASIHAHGEARDFRTAVDRVVDRLSRQLRKNHARRRDHQGPPKDTVILDERTR
jgi:ribosomal subunit interface protein